MRLWARIAIAAGVLLLALAGLVLWIAQSDWLRERVRQEVVVQAEKISGGRVELGAFRWDWHTMTVSADHLVVHGTEPAGSAPLLVVEHIDARLRIVSFLSKTIAIESIDVERPNASLIVTAGGATNIPGPKVQSGKPGMQTLLDLKIGRFDLRNGMFELDSPNAGPKRTPWSVRGENLASHLEYDSAGKKYAGTVALDPLLVASGRLRLSATGALERDRITVSEAHVASGDSEIVLNDGEISHFDAPVYRAGYKGHISCKSDFYLCPAGVSGTLDVDGRGSFVSALEYQSSGEFTGTGGFGQIRNARFSGRFDAAPRLLALHDIRASALGGSVLAEATVRDFSAYAAHGHMDHFDMRQLAALETKQPLPYDGLISGAFDVAGTFTRSGALVNAKLQIAPTGKGPAARGEVAVRYDTGKALVELSSSWLELPHSRIDVSGTPGATLQVKAQSTDIRDLLPAIAILSDNKPPEIAFSSASFQGTISGPLQNPRIEGHGSAQDLKVEGQAFESLAGDIALSSDFATVRNGLVAFGDVRAQGNGTVALKNWRTSPTSTITATVDLHNADVAKVLAMAGHKEVPVTGILSASGKIMGTVGAPLTSADITLSRGSIYSQPFDSITGKLDLVDRNTQALTGLFVSGAKRVNISARFVQSGTEFPSGILDFNLTSNTMALNQIAMIRARQPDIKGFGKFHADGTLRIGHDAKSEVQFSLTSMNADASANSLELDGRNLGDARFTASTKGDVMQAQFDSNAAKAVIHGTASVKLDGDYPVTAKVAFSNVSLNAVAALAVKEQDAHSLNFDGEAEGEATISGPAMKPELLKATIDIPRVEVRPLPGSDFAKTSPQFVLTNDGPLRMELSNSQVRIENAHFKAPQTDLTVDGAVSFAGDAPLNLRVRGDVNLAVARSFNKDLTSTGVLSVNGTVRGKWNAPDIGGRAVLRNGEFRYTDFSNGLTNVNGEIVFNGTRATIQSLTAETGGGKVQVTGFAALNGGTANFRVEATAQQIRVRYPEGVSSVSDAVLTFYGTPDRSEVSGNITIHRVSINPRTDAANILASTAAPLEAPATHTGFTSNMNLDVKVQTAPDVALQTSVAQSLQADASLTLRGTAANPAVLGRINVTQGEIVFFGNKYAINQGTISFFNPARIDPILNIDLETKARGVDVVLTVAGPMNGLNVSYRSDPPLQFSDIVALLATGRTPGDPTLAVRDTGQSQSFSQLGASTLLGQAIANPVAGRLQRFFGVSRLKIDPQLTGITGSPEARLTLEQQVTPDILFTYITDVSSTSTQLIRVEWSFDRHWSAILIREANGYVGLDFAYKKRFK